MPSGSEKKQKLTEPIPACVISNYIDDFSILLMTKGILGSFFNRGQ